MQEHKDYPKMLTVPQAAEILNTSRKTVYEMIRSGRLPHIRLDTGECLKGKFRIPRDRLYEIAGINIGA